MGVGFLALLLATSCYKLSPSPFLDASVDDTESESDTGPGFDGELEWALRAGGDAAYDEVGLALDVFSDGDFLVAGYHGDGAVFGEGEATETLAATPPHDMFLARYDRDGALEWARRVGDGTGGGTNQSHNEGRYLRILSDDSFVVAGSFFGPDPVVFGEDDDPNQTALQPASAAFDDFYAARFAADGSLVFAVKAGGWGDDHMTAAFVSADEETLWVTGAFSQDATFAGPDGADEVVLSTAASFCADGALGATMFLAAYDLATGALRWARQAEGCSVGLGISGAGDAEHLLVTGRFEESAAFGSAETAVPLDSAGDEDAFVARFNAADGSLDWAVSSGGGGLDKGAAVTGLTDGSALVTGLFSGSASFQGFGIGEELLDVGEGSGMFAAVYSATGDLSWAKTLATGGEGALEVGAQATLAGGDFLLGGSFLGEAAMGESGQTAFASRGSTDAFLARFAESGDLLWARREGGAGEDRLFGLALPTDDTAIAVGGFSDTVLFGEGEPGETALTALGVVYGGPGDIYAMKVGIE